MNRLTVAALLFAFGSLSNAFAQSGAMRLQALLAKEQNPQCVLADPKKVICHVAGTSEMYLLQAGDEGLSPRLLVSLPAASSPSTPAAAIGARRWDGKPLYAADGPRASLWDLSAHDDGAGNIVVAWRYNRDFVHTINLLWVRRDGQLQRTVVKEFSAHEPIFDLRTYVVRPDFIQFFYSYYSEQYFSPIKDAGSIQKLWTLGYRDGKTVFNTQLSSKGSVHSTLYDAAHHGNGQFGIAWQAETIGSVVGPRRKLKIGTVSNGQDSPSLKEFGEIPIEQLVSQDRLILPIVAPPRQHFTAVASISYGKDGHLYKMHGSSGDVLGEHRVQGDVVTEFGYDSGSPPLFRYVKGRLMHFPERPSSINAEVHWTDFSGRDWVEKLVVPFGSIFPQQNVADCFYWLEPDGAVFELRKKCRRPA